VLGEAFEGGQRLAPEGVQLSPQLVQTVWPRLIEMQAAFPVNVNEACIE
jgi:hypothetical protein